MTGSVSNTSLSVTLLGLIPFREYTCNVTAITNYGRGISANVSAVTDEAAPSEVTSLNVASVQSNTSFLIWWSPPNQANGIITNYTVTISHYDSNTVIHNVSTNNLSITVSTGLIEYIPYIISVSGSTSAGKGNESKAIAFIKEGVPPAVEGVRAYRVNESTVNVSWNQLSLTKARGFLKSYTVILSSSNTIKHQNVVSFNSTVPSTESSVVFTNLQANTDYTVSVLASTSVGTGPANTVDIEQFNNGSTSSTVIEATSPSNDGLADSTVIIIVVAVILFTFLFAVVTVGIVIVIMKKKFNYVSDTRSKTAVYDDPDISLKEVKPQAVNDDVKIESTDPISAADYEVPVTAITEETVDKAM